MADYHEFLNEKRILVPQVGFSIPAENINKKLFPFQADLARWAIRKGRCAIFADTGLGKTFMQLEWARLLDGRVMIIAPLAVTKQTIAEGKRLGIMVHYTRSGDDLTDGINITNYEMAYQFDPTQFKGVVLDESSILKSLDGKLRRQLTLQWQQTHYRLCCTATPAPNDISEIGRHAEFLGIMTSQEMLAAFFVNDLKMKDGTWRLKRHAVKNFYRWLASWGMAIRKPSDLGYEDDGYILPELNIEVVSLDSDFVPDGMLPGFFVGDVSAIEAKKIRRKTITERVDYIAKMVNASNESWVIWGGLNDETDALDKAIPDATNVYGAMSPEEKADHLMDFVNGDSRVLVTKSTIAGFGMNMQHCHNMVFCGLDFSWERYYQAVRRCWRFGQKHTVNVYIVITEQERNIFDSIMKKEKQSLEMVQELVNESAQYAKEEIMEAKPQEWEYTKDTAQHNGWKMLLGDSVECINEIPDNSVDLSVFSPPFISLYTYTPTERDMGNSQSSEQFFHHFDYIIRGLERITKPGRNCAVHVQQVAATKVNDGYIGIKDFRGDVIRAFVEAGWIMHGEITIDKNPQVQAIRTKTKGLMFVQLHKDSVASRPALADYLLIFQKPGDNEVPVIPDITNDEWIQWAHPVWYDITETDVLNVKVARSNDDERHICPLQLPLIERCIRLWTNKDEMVFDPFAGIGSTGYEAIRLGRKFTGIELKPEYYRVACNNLKNAERLSPMDLFTWAERQNEVEQS